jgi:hypothetical protein
MDDIIRYLRASGRPATREAWLGFVFGGLTNKELLDLVPQEIAMLFPGEELGSQEPTIEAEKQYSTPFREGPQRELGAPQECVGAM